jgi:cation transport ATPase
MPIQVTCPKCFKRFQVSDKFAGKSGPCPNCKEQIRVPDKSEEVVIHAPDDGAPKDRSGQSVLKPLKRKETDVTRRGLLLTTGAILIAVGLAFGVRWMQLGDGAMLAVKIIGALVLAPPLVWAGYTFVRDSELAPYTGTELRNRVLILSVIFAALWLIYAFVPSYVLELDAAWEMSYVTFGVVFLIMLVAGAFASVGTFELEFFNGLAHAGLYLLVTLGLAVISGIQLATS